jgi:hypothetical protein
MLPLQLVFFTLSSLFARIISSKEKYSAPMRAASFLATAVLPTPAGPRIMTA